MRPHRTGSGDRCACIRTRRSWADEPLPHGFEGRLRSGLGVAPRKVEVVEPGPGFLMAVPTPSAQAARLDEVEGVLDHAEVGIEAHVDGQLRPVVEAESKLADLDGYDHSGSGLDDRYALVLPWDHLAAETHEPGIDPEDGLGGLPDVRGEQRFRCA